ncbi:hypothetical protein [Planococcus beigongshangi]|nr:hypothetical protein [Planococcus beigongshangi]
MLKLFKRLSVVSMRPEVKKEIAISEWPEVKKEIAISESAGF